MKSNWFRSVFVSLLLCACASAPEQPADSLPHDEAVFHWYMHELQQTIPDEEHLYLLLPDLACRGCQEEALRQLGPSPDGVTLILSPAKLSRLREARSLPHLVDRDGLLNELNWDYRNIIAVATARGNVLSINDYSSDNLLSNEIFKN